MKAEIIELTMSEASQFDPALLSRTSRLISDVSEALEIPKGELTDKIIKSLSDIGVEPRQLSSLFQPEP